MLHKLGIRPRILGAAPATTNDYKREPIIWCRSGFLRFPAGRTSIDCVIVHPHIPEN